MKYISIYLLMSTLTISAQDSLPFKSIENLPQEMTMGNLMARMVDGLGFRYYWATEALREEDLSYKISDSSRTTLETLEHLLGLSNFVAKVASNESIVVPREPNSLSWEEMRAATLHNLQTAREHFANSDSAAFNDFVISFQRGDKTSEVPFWNLLNGPLADAIYHVGQIVTYRRASGNPMDPGVNVFQGKRQ